MIKQLDKYKISVILTLHWLKEIIISTFICDICHKEKTNDITKHSEIRLISNNSRLIKICDNCRKLSLSKFDDLIK